MAGGRKVIATNRRASHDYFLEDRYEAGLVLTGGSAMLTGARELAEQVFDLPVRIGTPIAVDGLSEVVNHPRYATGVGLLYHDGEARSRTSSKTNNAKRLRTSFTQLKRAIASFI